MSNVYFELTRELNADRPIAALASGQAVVYYRIAIMSKDGDWVLRESEEACGRVLSVLGGRQARYRPGAPLDVRWLAGGWSSHFELRDERERRVRCDFFSRPPRIPFESVEAMFAEAGGESGELLVVGVDQLIRMKQTQRAKDYPAIGELARLLPPAEELERTTDPDRILELAPQLGADFERPAVRAAREGAARDEVVTALAREIDAMQRRDRDRVERYRQAAAAYLLRFREAGLSNEALEAAHPRVVELAERWLPRSAEEEC